MICARFLQCQYGCPSKSLLLSSLLSSPQPFLFAPHPHPHYILFFPHSLSPTGPTPVYPTPPAPAVLKGTDSRSYILDAMRLTPRDANYVLGPKGTGNIPEDALKCVDRNIAVTYVLRQELINSYAQVPLPAVLLNRILCGWMSICFLLCTSPLLSTPKLKCYH